MAKRVVFVSPENRRVFLGEDLEAVYLSHRGNSTYRLSIYSKHKYDIEFTIDFGGVVDIYKAKQAVLNTVERWLDPYDGVMVLRIDFVKEIEALLGGFNGVSNH